MISARYAGDPSRPDARQGHRGGVRDRIAERRAACLVASQREAIRVRAAGSHARPALQRVHVTPL